MRRRTFLTSALASAAFTACGGRQRVSSAGPLSRPHEPGVHHIGNSTHFIVTGGLGVLTDPWLHDPAEGVLSHRVKPAEIPQDPDLILITHEHEDHFDDKALAALDKSAVLVVPRWMKEQAEPLGFQELILVEAGQSLEVRGASIDVVQGAHDIDELVYRFEHDGMSVFFGGDSLLTDEMIKFANRRPTKTCLLPAEFATLLGTQYSMEPHEAIELAERFGSETTILSHHESYVSHNFPVGWLVDVQAPDPADFPEWFKIPTPGELIRFA